MWMSFSAPEVLLSCLLGLQITLGVTTSEPSLVQDPQLLLQSPVILQLKNVACAKEASAVECNALFNECLLLLSQTSDVQGGEKCDQPDCHQKSQKCVVLLEPYLEILKRIAKDGQIVDPSYYGDLGEGPEDTDHSLFKRFSLDEESPESSNEEFRKVPPLLIKFKHGEESTRGEFSVGEKLGTRICANKDTENCVEQVAKCYDLIGPESPDFGSLETAEAQECYQRIQTLVQGEEVKSEPVCDNEECETCTAQLQGNKELKRAEIVCLFQITDNLSMKECMIFPVRKHLLTTLPGYLGQQLYQRLDICYETNTYEGIFPCLAKYCSESWFLFWL
ncbi:uncharacterized protein [Macrobrachium rosenbergii]|uniref:uncharacterized protein n=1 Tax=Macrobrachium rosenbergii TaxID=79674 RepID=UPI0034D7A1C0